MADQQSKVYVKYMNVILPLPLLRVLKHKQANQRIFRQLCNQQAFYLVAVRLFLGPRLQRLIRREGFSLCSLVFLSPFKPTLLNSNLIWNLRATGL